MIRAIRRYLRRNRTAKALRERSREAWHEGEISANQFIRIRNASYDNQFVDDFLKKLEQDDELLGGVRWDNFVEWLKENWPAILKLVLSLLVVLDEQDS